MFNFKAIDPILEDAAIKFNNYDVETKLIMTEAPRRIEHNGKLLFINFVSPNWFFHSAGVNTRRSFFDSMTQCILNPLKNSINKQPLIKRSKAKIPVFFIREPLRSTVVKLVLFDPHLLDAARTRGKNQSLAQLERNKRDFLLLHNCSTIRRPWLHNFSSAS